MSENDSKARKYYVFRINYGDKYQIIINELFNNKQLRQGWGCEGMDISKKYESFLRGWKKAWPSENIDEDRVARKFRNLLIMREMQPGDIIVIPKVCKVGNNWRKFTVARCKGLYSFSPLEEERDFGHLITVEPLFSCSYEHNSASRTVSAKFKGYQSALNRVFNEDFIYNVDKLIADWEINRSIFEKDDITSLSALIEPTSDARKNYLQKIVSVINGWKSDQLEKLITELFNKQGFETRDSHIYDGKGADIDSYSHYSLRIH